MNVTYGDFWTYDAERVVARVIQTEGGRVLGGEVPFQREVLEAAIRERDEKYGQHLQAFSPQPDKGRYYWLLVWPVELDYKRVAEELLCFTLGMLPDDGWVLLPDGAETEDDLYDVLNQPVVMSTKLLADGRVVHDSVVHFGNRFVAVLPEGDS